MFEQGSFYKGFFVKRSFYLEELQATFREIEHIASKAEIIRIENDDPENLFCISFQTLPYNSNGIAHILEHVVLCGSRKFPVKDPFFAMIRRSLNTFMNAITGPDYTCYPAATQIEKDFYNLLEVYLDALFYPQLKKESFFQEGCRLTYVDSENVDSPLEWKGVVYNEMKGALLSSESRIWRTMLALLLPDLTYAHLSGGDPSSIPSLTYEELVSFYHAYYAPSRSLFFFYGNFDLGKQLDFIEEQILKNATPLPPLPTPPKQLRYTTPIHKVSYYPVTEKEFLKKGSIVAWGWLTVSIQEEEEKLALLILDLILMENDASLLKLPLLRSGWCTSVDSYFDTEISELPFLILAKGVAAEEIEDLDKLLWSSLEAIAASQIPHHLIESALHQLEFARTEISSDFGPFGLSLFTRSILAKQHGTDPETGLLIRSLFKKLRKLLEEPTYLPRIIRKHFLENGHRVRLDFHPDPLLVEKEAEEERKRLELIKEKLSPKEKRAIAENSKLLADYQKQISNQSLDSLPTLTLKEIPAKSPHFPLEQNREIFFHDCFTNGIVYAQFLWDLPHLEEEELPYAQLLISLMPELGMGSRDYKENLSYIQAHIKGLSIQFSLYVQRESPSLMKPALILKGKALERNIPSLFTLLRELASESRLDESKRIKELILQIHTRLRNRLEKNSLRYASQISLSGLSIPSKISEKWSGLSYFRWISELIINLDSKLPSLIEKLFLIKNRLFSLHNKNLILSSNRSNYDFCNREQFFGLLTLPDSTSSKPWQGNYSLEPTLSQGRVIASPVAFCSKSFSVCSSTNPLSAPLAIASHLMDYKILFPKIREEGGAYGCGTNYDSNIGSFTFHSYRDPQIATTLQTFQEAAESVAAGKFDAKDLEAAKLETIQQIDHPISPGSRASTSYSWLRTGYTRSVRQNYRDQLLSCSGSEVQKAVEANLLSEGTVVVFASERALEKENRQMKTPLPIIPI